MFVERHYWSSVEVQTIATVQLNISQHCWPSICKPRQNDRNISTQHTATLFGTTCCHRLAALLRRVATRCELKIEPVPIPVCNLAKALQHQALAKRSQHFNATCRHTVGRNMSRASGHHVLICCQMFGVGSNLKMVKFFMQHLWILHDVVVVWGGSYNNVAPGHAH